MSAIAMPWLHGKLGNEEIGQDCPIRCVFLIECLAIRDLDGMRFADRSWHRHRDMHDSRQREGETMRLSNRTDAGHRLASRLKQYEELEDLVVLGLPRGGVRVAFAVAEQLGASADTFVAHKVGVPGHEELAMGAVASSGVTVRNEKVLEGLGVPSGVFEAGAQEQRREVERREGLYRNGRSPPKLRGRNAILTDDGLATGATMKAAVEAVRKAEPRRLIVAVPVERRANLSARPDSLASLTLSPYLAGRGGVSGHRERPLASPVGESEDWESVVSAIRHTICGPISSALPSAVDSDSVEAKLEGGVLHMEMKKTESAGTRKIEVK